MLPGVANRDARAVFEARTHALRTLLEAGDDVPVGRALSQAVRLRLWRAGNVTGFDAWVEQLIGLDAPRARALAHRAAEELGQSLEPLPGPVLALWLRAEAALLRAGIDGFVDVVGDGPDAKLRLKLSVDRVSKTLGALEELGRTAAGLQRVLDDGSQ